MKGIIGMKDERQVHQWQIKPFVHTLTQRNKNNSAIALRLTSFLFIFQLIFN